VTKTCHALAAVPDKVYLLTGKTDPDEKRLLSYYGLPGSNNLTIVQLPILRMRGKVRFSWHGVFNFGCLWWLWRTGRRKKIDIIHLRSVKLANFLLKFRWLLRAPMVLGIHQLPRLYTPGAERTKDKRKQRFFSKVDGLVVTTEALKRGLNELYTVAVPVTTAPPGCEMPAEALAPLSRHSPPEIFYIGQLYPLQGVDLLIEAMRDIEYARLNIVGGKEEEIYALKGLAERLEVGSRVLFHGFVEPGRVKEKMAGADVLVLPSRSQGKMPCVSHLKLFEYMAAGRPIVATNLPSISEFVLDGESAILVEPDSSVSLAQGIKKVLEDEALARRLASNAFEAAAKFTWRNRARALVQFFHSILEKRRRELNVRSDA